MSFQILFYGNDRTSKYEGETLMEKLSEQIQKNDISTIDFFKVGRNKEWYDASKELMSKNKPPLPYPSSIILKLNQFFGNIFVDILPRLCYVVVYVDNDQLEEFLKKNFKNMMK